MSDLLGNHIVGFPMRRLIYEACTHVTFMKQILQYFYGDLISSMEHNVAAKTIYKLY